MALTIISLRNPMCLDRDVIRIKLSTAHKRILDLTLHLGRGDHGTSPDLVVDTGDPFNPTHRILRPVTLEWPWQLAFERDSNLFDNHPDSLTLKQEHGATCRGGIPGDFRAKHRVLGANSDFNIVGNTHSTAPRFTAISA